MKLFHLVLWRISLALIVVLTVTIQNWRIDYHVSFPYLRAKLKT